MINSRHRFSPEENDLELFLKVTQGRRNYRCSRDHISLPIRGLYLAPFPKYYQLMVICTGAFSDFDGTSACGRQTGIGIGTRWQYRAIIASRGKKNQTNTFAVEVNSLVLWACICLPNLFTNSRGWLIVTLMKCGNHSWSHIDRRYSTCAH